MVQPGMPIEAAGGIVSALRARFPSARDPLPGGACYAASDRAATVRSVASAGRVVLVLGSADSPDTRHVCGLARDRGAKTHVVAETGDIVPAMISGTSAIGSRNRPRPRGIWPAG